MSASMEDVRFQIEAADTLNYEYDGRKRPISCLEFLEALGLDTSEQLDLITLLDAVPSDKRWHSISVLGRWTERANNVDFTCFDELLRRAAIDSPADREAPCGAVRDFLRDQDPEIKAAVLFSIPNKIEAGKIFESLYNEDADDRPGSPIETLREMMSFTFRFPHLADSFPATDLRNVLLGFKETRNESRAAEIVGFMLDDDQWPLDFPIQASDLPIRGTGIPIDRIISNAVKYAGNCTMDRLLAFVRSFLSPSQS